MSVAYPFFQNMPAVYDKTSVAVCHRADENVKSMSGHDKFTSQAEQNGHLVNYLA
ncbi:MAG: hypothetical protein ACI9HX_000731 [Pseudoalteromonas tetraodonis]|jgi:hypothetical protein